MSSSEDGGPIFIPIGLYDAGQNAKETIEQLPPQLRMLAGLSMTAISALVAFANDPWGFVVEIIVAFVVNTFLSLGWVLIGSVQWAFFYVAAVPRFIGDAIISAVKPVGLFITGQLGGFGTYLAETAASAGPAAPFIVGGATLVVLVIGGRAVISLGGSLPVVGAILDFLGVDE